jgi:hypothetical protein
MFQIKFVEVIKAHILCSVTFFFFRKSCRLRDSVEKYCEGTETADEKMASRFMLDK